MDEVCEWKYDEPIGYHTSCDDCFYFDYGGIIENRFNFCPRCGKKIVEIIPANFDLQQEEEL